MAGMGPAPKDASQRRRRNEPARGEWVEIPNVAPNPPVLPALPERLDEPWSDLTIVMWNAWRADPVSATFGPAEIAYALDSILLYEESRASKANELRLRMDGLGLTPKGKRDLRLRVVEPEAAAAAPTPTPKRRRDHLRVVLPA